MALQRRKINEFDNKDTLQPKKEYFEDKTKFKGRAENNMEEMHFSRKDESSSNENDENLTGDR